MPSLKDLQIALAQQLTSSGQALRTINSSGVLADFDPEELQASRESLVRKRLSQISTLLPRTTAALQENFNLLCRQYIDHNHVQGPQAIQLDAVRFGRWLQEQSISDWIKEFASWEVLRVEWLSSKYFLRVVFLRYRIENDQADGIEPPRVSSLWLAWRFGRWGRIRRLGRSRTVKQETQ